MNRLDNYCNQCLQFPNYSQVWKASKVFLKLQECVFSQKKFFLSFNQKEQVIVSEESSCHPSSFATSHPDPRDACGVLCYQKKHKMLERQYIEISTGQSASPSLERLPSSSPTTQPSQWWGTSMKYLQLDWVTTTLCLHRVIKLLEVIVNNIDIYCIFITSPFKFLYHINTTNDI